MPARLKRYYNANHLHFITCSCYRRRPLLASARRRDLFLQLQEQARRRYQFVVVGYVVMPEHFHLLISEPEQGDPSLMKIVKQRFARKVHRKRSSAQLHLWGEAEDEHVWQKRFYDFNVWSERKQVEKLRYMHRNPVKRGLVAAPDQWAWSSFLAFADGEQGRVRVNFQEWELQIKETRGIRGVAGSLMTPFQSQKARLNGAPRAYVGPLPANFRTRQSAEAVHRSSKWQRCTGRGRMEHCLSGHSTR